MPPYRLPHLGSVVRMMWERSRVFVQEAGTVILACTIAMWFLTGFLSALAAAGVYFFVLPLITMPLLEALKVIPERKDRYSKEDR
ncbi:MAG: hypothetical protein L0191_20515 [Acidobacteria bacterium]|nr:hypothetical protein [Acidobacteriota bacterium]